MAQRQGRCVLGKLSSPVCLGAEHMKSGEEPSTGPRREVRTHPRKLSSCEGFESLGGSGFTGALEGAQDSCYRMKHPRVLGAGDRQAGRDCQAAPPAGRWDAHPAGFSERRLQTKAGAHAGTGSDRGIPGPAPVLAQFSRSGQGGGPTPRSSTSCLTFPPSLLTGTLVDV